MRLVLAFTLVACTVPATMDTGLDTALDTSDSGDPDSGDTGDADSGDTADTDTADTDSGDTGTDTGDTDTGKVNYLSGNWAGTLHLDVTESGFALATGSCEAAITVSLPEDNTQVPAGTGSLTCATGTTSDSTWSLVGESLAGDAWSGTATVAVGGWPSGTAGFSGRAERGTLALDVEAGGIADGEWAYDWAASSVTLFRE